MDNLKRKKSTSRVQITVFDGERVVSRGSFDYCPVIIGRGPQADLQLNDYKFVSRLHATVDERDGNLILASPQGQSNFIFDNRATSVATLRDRSDIYIARLRIHFEIGEVIATQASREDLKDDDTLSTPAHDLPGRPQDLTPSHPLMPPPSLPLIPVEIVDPVKDHHVNDPSFAAGSGEGLARLPISTAIRTAGMVLEGYITWKGRIYDLHQYAPGEDVIIGPMGTASLTVPILNQTMTVASLKDGKMICVVPGPCSLTVEGGGQRETTPVRGGYTFAIELERTYSFKLAYDVEVSLRYIPQPPRLRLNILSAQELSFRETAALSLVIHVVIVALLVIFTPKSTAPQIDNVPPRYARLLVEPPRTFVPAPPPPPPPPPPKPEPAKPVVKSEPKPIKKPVRITKQKKINKYPIDLPSQRIAKTPANMKADKPTPNVTSMGALAALGAVSAANPNLSNQPVAINVNPNAGGAKSLSTTGVVGALKAQGGRLQAAGSNSVKTAGTGYGTGAGYGVQGVKGSAGSRGVGGAVVGVPKLMSIDKAEGLTQAQVMAVVRRHAGEIQQCYEKSLLSSPNLAGRIEYEWVINAGGRVTSVQVKRSDMQGADELNACVVKVFRRMDFPKARNGQETTPSIGFPFGRL